jgi:hypothetical protein
MDIVSTERIPITYNHGEDNVSIKPNECNSAFVHDLYTKWEARRPYSGLLAFKINETVASSVERGKGGEGTRARQTKRCIGVVLKHGTVIE